MDTISLGFGSFTDLTTSSSMKNFASLYGLNQDNKTNLGSAGVTDFRSLYIFKNEQLDPDFLKSQNLIIVNCNPRYESPLLNLQIKATQQENEIEIFILGFLSNTNFTFTHIGQNGSKLAFLNFFEKNADSVLVIGGQTQNKAYAIDVTRTNYV